MSPGGDQNPEATMSPGGDQNPEATVTTLTSPTALTNPTAATARALLARTAPWMLVSFGVIAAVYTVISFGVAIVGTGGNSAWASAGWVLQWIAFGGGIALGASTPVLIAYGIARRTILIAGAATLLGLAAGMAALVQAGLAAEWVLWRAGGASHDVDGAHLFAEVGQVHLVLAEFGTMFMAFLSGGWLVWAAYYRAGWWRGTLALPLTGLPVWGALVALSAGYRGAVGAGGPAWTATLGPGPAVALGLAAASAGLVGVWAVTRAVPVR